MKVDSFIRSHLKKSKFDRLNSFLNISFGVSYAFTILKLWYLLHNGTKISFYSGKSMQMIAEYAPLAFPFYYENIHPLFLWEEKAVTER